MLSLMIICWALKALLPMSEGLRPYPDKPVLQITGENGESWGLGVDPQGFIVALVCTPPKQCWYYASAIPPKLAAHMELFLTQNFHILNNKYGLPKPEGGNDGAGFID